jgi:hypothetical protein
MTHSPGGDAFSLRASRWVTARVLSSVAKSAAGFSNATRLTRDRRKIDAESHDASWPGLDLCRPAGGGGILGIVDSGGTRRTGPAHHDCRARPGMQGLPLALARSRRRRLAAWPGVTRYDRPDGACMVNTDSATGRESPPGLCAERRGCERRIWNSPSLALQACEMPRPPQTSLKRKRRPPRSTPTSAAAEPIQPGRSSRPIRQILESRRARGVPWLQRSP